jgi:hypothetical protein
MVKTQRLVRRIQKLFFIAELEESLTHCQSKFLKPVVSLLYEKGSLASYAFRGPRSRSIKHLFQVTPLARSCAGQSRLLFALPLAGAFTLARLIFWPTSSLSNITMNNQIATRMPRAAENPPFRQVNASAKPLM